VYKREREREREEKQREKKVSDYYFLKKMNSRPKKNLKNALLAVHDTSTRDVNPPVRVYNYNSHPTVHLATSGLDRTPSTFLMSVLSFPYSSYGRTPMNL
jgi:hypothetical protein